MRSLNVVVLLLVGCWGTSQGLGDPSPKRNSRQLQEDFEFVEDGKDRGSGSSGERRTWMLDPDNALCGLLRCGRREVCLLQDRFTAVCVNKQEVTKNGDKIIPLKEATTSKANEELPKSWDALDDYDDDDDYEDDDDYLLDD